MNTNKAGKTISSPEGCAASKDMNEDVGDCKAVRQALQTVQEKIKQAAKESVRPEIPPQLIAVSKTFPASHIRPALEVGQHHFGENKVQEAAHKWPALREKFPDTVLHLIGPLQSNKAGQAVALFDFIHTVDREKIARALAREMEKSGKKPALLVQVNTGKEPQKAGVNPHETKAFVRFCQQELRLKIRGLMCIPPRDEEAALHFGLLAKLADEAGVRELSMGMSADYEKAVRFGASWVRVGTAIFGGR